MSQTTPIDQVPKDYDEIATGVITSPLHEEFKWKFNGKKVVIPGMIAKKKGNKTYWTKNPSQPISLPACMLVAHHLAQKVVQGKHRKKIKEAESKEDRKRLEREAIPQYKKQCWDIMMKIVKGYESTEQPKNF